MTGDNLHMNITQIVPPEWCFKCDVCCRFLDKDSFLAPYFTHDEISNVTAYVAGTVLNSISNFASKQGGCKITLVPYEEGFICPEFNPDTAHCKIYDVRPLDCIIYPFAIMWSKGGKEIVLGFDMKCPYVSEFLNADSLKEFAIEMGKIIDSAPVRDIISCNPDLIGPYQDDVAYTAVLTSLSLAFTGSFPRSR